MKNECVYCVKEETRLEGPLELGSRKKNGRPKFETAKDCLDFTEEDMLALPRA